METKVCSKCGESKAFSCFGLRVDSPDGRRGVCKSCRQPQLLASSRRYAALNPDRKKKSFREWYARNADAQRDRNRKYAAENSDSLRQKRIDRYWRNPEKYRRLSLESAANNRPAVNARMRDWYARNPSAVERKNRASTVAGKSARRELRDTYLRKILSQGTAMTFSDVPDSLIEAKRVHLQIKRLLKEIK